MSKNSNNLLLIGLTILIVGLFLLSYSISTYKEVKDLASKIDFEELDYNNMMSSSDKYFKYLSYSDYLNQNLKRNKDLLLKNTSCVYLDYAQHNAVSLYKLTYRGFQTEYSRKNVAAGNVRALYNMLDNYKACKQYSAYKLELEHILEDIQKSDVLFSDRENRMEAFLEGYNPQNLNTQVQTSQQSEEPQIPQNVDLNSIPSDVSVYQNYDENPQANP